MYGSLVEHPFVEELIVITRCRHYESYGSAHSTSGRFPGIIYGLGEFVFALNDTIFASAVYLYLTL